MSRECPEPRKESRGNRGGSNSGTGDRNTGFQSSANNNGNTFRTLRNQNDNDRGDSGETKPAFVGWRGGATSTANDNNGSDEAEKRTAFGSSTTRGGFTNSSGGFRGNEVF
jgi:hypothetical protein